MMRCTIIAILSVLSIACHQDSSGNTTSSSQRKTSQGLVRRGLPGEVDTLDPHLANDTYSLPVVRDLFEGLTSEDQHGHPVPGVASEWTVSENGTLYTFTIRPTAKWSNGERITADDFVRGLRHAVDPKTASGSAALLSVIKGANKIIAGQQTVEALAVRAVGEQKVEIELENPAPYVLQILSEPIAAPMRERSADTRNPISNGPYKLAGRVLGSYIELEKNFAYWNAENVAIDRVRYNTQESESTELREYLSGQLDLTSTIPTADLKRLESSHSAEIQSAPFLGTVYLALDTTERPLSIGPPIRQALSMTIDREAISENVIIGVTPAYSFVANGVTGYTSAAYEWRRWTKEERIQAARRLYAQSGFSATHPLHLKLYFNSGDAVNRTMIAIAADWKESLGVETELRSTEFRVFLAEKANRSLWDVTRLGWFADFDDPSSFLDVFSSAGKQNDPGFYSQTYDSIVRKAEAASEMKERNALFESAERILLTDYPIIPLYFYRQRRLVNTKLYGAEITPLNHSRSQFLRWGQQ